MVMAGRKPLPTKVKQIKGTLQKCRTNLREPKPQGDLVDPPDYMPEGAKAARLRHSSSYLRATRTISWPLAGYST